jgi:hypothetical protein
MTTPLEDRVSALEAWKATVDPQLVQANSTITNLRNRVTTLETQLTAAGPRLTALETNYADAVKRFQKAERLVARLRVILGIIWKSTSSSRADYLAHLDPEARAQAAKDLEEIDNMEHINRREDPDEWREPVNGA